MEGSDNRSSEVLLAKRVRRISLGKDVDFVPFTTRSRSCQLEAIEFDKVLECSRIGLRLIDRHVAICTNTLEPLGPTVAFHMRLTVVNKLSEKTQIPLP